MVSMARTKFKQRQQRTDKKFIIPTGPIACSNKLGVRMQNRGPCLYNNLWLVAL